MEASFDNNFPPSATESYDFDTLPPDPSVSGISLGDITKSGATATVTVAHPNGSTVYLRHKASTDANFGTPQEATASSETVVFTLGGLSAEVLYEVEASFDSNFQSDVQTASFRTKPAPSVSGVAMSNVSQTGATATVTVANPDGSTVYLRHKAATDANFGTAQEAAADTGTVAFHTERTVGGTVLRGAGVIRQQFPVGRPSHGVQYDSRAEPVQDQHVERHADRGDGDVDRQRTRTGAPSTCATSRPRMPTSARPRRPLR